MNEESPRKTSSRAKSSRSSIKQSEYGQNRKESAANSEKSIEFNDPQSDSDKEDEEEKKPLWLRIMKASFSHVGMSIMVILYCGLGGFIFEHLEATNEETYCKTGMFKYTEVLNATVDLMWDIVNQNDLNEDEKFIEFGDKLDKFRVSVQNGTFEGGLDDDCAAMEKSWSFLGSSLFAVTVVTTVGYGHISPKTYWGKLVCIAYAMLGIPLTLVMLANIGDLLADMFRFVYTKICCCGCCRRRDRTEVKEITDINNQNERPLSGQEDGRTIIENEDESQTQDDENNDEEDMTVPLTVTMSVMAGWILFGATVFSVVEPGWSMTVSAYYSFITVSTIGFGDYVPGTENIQSPDTRGKLVITALYMVIGMAMLSMCFTLMQDEVVDKIQWLGEKFGCFKTEEDEDEEEDEEEGDDKSVGSQLNEGFEKETSFEQERTSARKRSGQSSSTRDTEL